MHLIRLGRWAGDRTGRERLLLILHVGYAFVPIGFLLNACSAFGIVPTGAGVHAWMAGAAGVMTLAVMSRASLGHTGQQLTASVATQAIYAFRSSLQPWRAFARSSSRPTACHCCMSRRSAGRRRSSDSLCYGPTLIGFDKHSAQRPVSA